MSHQTDLDTRTGLSDELLFLLRQYPRQAWDAHPNLGGMARFWLDRHNGFRQLGGVLEDALSRFREGEMEPHAFGAFFAPRLQQFLSELHHHHMIEDQHYFPVFMAAETRLTRGFEVLEGDHEMIHTRIEQVIASANGLLGHLQGTDRDAIRRAADGYAVDSDRLIGGLMRHLDDEEDLIVPLILERGEGPLGIG
ncbi:hemerythrin domain-containing protein [Stappia sp. ES.058]|uniref:hemerythrin domain-containing protein n=1 Tax=Stappia sp. ES.058 TaxID=1881061 RepID=UPI00087B8313|nr:hemerythrin domain-containing protein [Stappia sp. ES.058]SDT92189.1 Hemerythrin HHE cation binding domain-containing protein [Stappia sp. ES.058]